MNHTLIQEFMVNGSGYKIHVLVDYAQPAEQRYFGRLYNRDRHIYRSGWWPSADEALQEILDAAASLTANWPTPTPLALQAAS